MTLEETLQAVYDSEINAKIEWCWDGGFDVTVGPWTPRDGVTGDRTHVQHASEIADAVQFLACEAYPKSKFVREAQGGESE